MAWAQSLRWIHWRIPYNFPHAYCWRSCGSVMMWAVLPTHPTTYMTWNHFNFNLQTVTIDSTTTSLPFKQLQILFFRTSDLAWQDCPLPVAHEDLYALLLEWFCLKWVVFVWFAWYHLSLCIKSTSGGLALKTSTKEFRQRSRHQHWHLPFMQNRWFQGLAHKTFARLQSKMIGNYFHEQMTWWHEQIMVREQF